MLTLEMVARLFSYDPETGVILRRITTGSNAIAGDVAGRIAHDGYRQIGIGDKRFPAHRIAWLMVYGDMPEGEIDHINGVRDDNRVVNLRTVSHKENQKNLKLSKRNTSGVVGVTYHRQAGKWQAYIKLYDKHAYLGLFSKFEDAVSARKAAEVAHDFHPNHGRVMQEIKP